MSLARFRIFWRFDGTTEGTVTIDRGSSVLSVRPYHRKRTYDLPLAFVAQLVAERVMKAEAMEKKAAKRRKTS